jgi:glycosyltransferase involved in cell wall biosynthesis
MNQLPGTRIQEISSSISASFSYQRPRAAGKFLYLGNEKLWIRGVTYGAFRPDMHGNEYHNLDVIERDFAQMAANGLNAVRIPHTVPPRSLLDAAQQYGLRVMVGLSAEQHIGFLIDKKDTPDIEEVVRVKVQSCAGHPALLCYALGNEISASLLRWLNRSRVERYLQRLYRIIKSEDPDGLVTYVNYPTTEYLQLPFLDLVCFNVYLESRECYEAYLARLQNIAGDRPLIMSEIGLDSLRNGEESQARALDWQIRTAFAAGCAGAFVFAWTDEWHRAGADVGDWAFGLTDAHRRPKPALAAVRKAFAEVPLPLHLHWPWISVIVCTYNGSRTIQDCLEGLLRLEYPNFEVLVVNDGSTDATADIVERYSFRLINTENRGLSSARNTGLEAATGEIVAYIDDDARPDPHWLTYLALTFMSTTHAGVGGPNIAPAGDGLIADCIANAPGGPVHVLLSDQEAEHIPGCNMAFRKAALQAIGGFDTQFHTAGDDVDVCWRLQQQGETLGFSPAAVVWHHRRNSVRTYWRQQVSYGKAEAQLERKWPEKYNVAGHLTWAGRVYGNGHRFLLGWKGRIYHGIWGSAPFQSLYQPSTGILQSLALIPEWYLVIVALAALSALGFLWSPLLFVLPLLAVAISAPLVQAVLSAAKASFTPIPRSHIARLKLHTLTAFLHILQPLARLWGRLRFGLTPWRRGTISLSLPRPWTSAIWTERWQDPMERLQALAAAMRASGVSVVCGGDYDRWDLAVRGGLLGAARILMAVEDHGAGRQLIRFRLWPTCPSGAVASFLLLSALSIWAAIDRAYIVAVVFSAVAVLLGLRTFQECAGATTAILHALQHIKEEA